MHSSDIMKHDERKNVIREALRPMSTEGLKRADLILTRIQSFECDPQIKNVKYSIILEASNDAEVREILQGLLKERE